MIDLLELPNRISRLLREESDDLEFQSTFVSDRGERNSNDDRCFLDEDHGIYLLVDGIGGHAGGKYASQIAASTISHAFESPEGTSACSCNEFEHCLETAVDKSCRSMTRLGHMNAKYEQMGCTLALAVRRKNKLYFTSAGCVRIYLSRRGKMRQLNHDDSLVQGLVDAHAVTAEDAKHHCWRNIITNSLTANGFAHEPKWRSIDLQKHDQVLIVTNGIYQCLKDCEIQEILSGSADVTEKAEQLVTKARDVENSHNASCILVSAG